MYDHFRDELFHKFMHISRKTFHKTHSELESIGLYRGQPPLLFSLWEKDEQSRKELGQSLRVQPATVTKMVKRLSLNGFLTSKQDGEDSRISRVCLTEKGKEVEAQVRGIYDGLKEDVFKGFSDEDLAQFTSYLDKIGSNLGVQTCKGRCEKEEGRNNG